MALLIKKDHALVVKQEENKKERKTSLEGGNKLTSSNTGPNSTHHTGTSPRIRAMSEHPKRSSKKDSTHNREQIGNISIIHNDFPQHRELFDCEMIKSLKQRRY
ncbi:MAG: hypothetical protein KBT55_02800 [Porticoccus sp.]|nr:hypothetical protein [Porticoccus sp.]